MRVTWKREGRRSAIGLPNSHNLRTPSVRISRSTTPYLESGGLRGRHLGARLLGRHIGPNDGAP